MSEVKFKSFKEFYPYYLSEHKLTINKLLHVIGSLSGLCFLFYCIIQKFYSYIPISFIFGYFFAFLMAKYTFLYFKKWIQDRSYGFKKS